jgi:ferric-dicitrate binding protein FerR (iron transport regulator)
MGDNQEHIYQLLLKKRNGTINESDDQYVSALIHGQEDVELMWRALKHSFSLPGEERFLQQLDPALAWTAVEEELLVIDHSRTSKIKKWLVAVGVAAAVLTGTGLLWISQHAGQKEAPVATTLPATKGLQLQLSNGQTIALPYNQIKQDIDAGDVQLSAGAKKLQYTGGEKMGEGFNTLVVPPKMDYKLVLSDGTEVWLNATSKLRFPFSFAGNKREVYLEGEGYFQVTKNAAKPFIVHTLQTDVEVLGTAFNINAYEHGNTRTSLVEGAVISKAGGKQVNLQPGQEAIFNSHAGYDVRSFESADVLAWMRGLYVFHNTSLTEIAGVIERWYGVHIEFDTPGLGNKKFTGGLHKQDQLQDFLETMQVIGDFKYHYDEKGVLHLK